MRIEKYGNHWAVYDDSSNLVCITVYKKGAKEVVKRLDELPENSSDIPASYHIELKELAKEVSQINKKFARLVKAIQVIENISKQAV